ncbi:hypothetical protein GSI_05277 [Ganoderma sinense ZZ0214-1]|uniref:R3H domain-containing protein n=1 Tax=Ganoderma sinense ZZ0214-1 TaxID=1077348 RepID=A0A2G8SFM5_9APHY|nr:hypothetical protein GSI_05277 [Ganoderma sinense ZZ0214-1]
MSRSAGHIPTSVLLENIPPNVERDEIEYRLGIKPYALIVTYPDGLAGCGKGFADFYRPAEASTAIYAIDGTMWNGHKVRASHQKIPDPTTRPPYASGVARIPLERLQYDTFGPITSIESTPPQSTTFTHDVDGSTRRGAELPTSSVETSAAWTRHAPPKELDLNDPWTLEMFTRILLFMNDTGRRDSLVFPPTMTSQERYTVHLLAQKLGVHHYTSSTVEGRSVVVSLHQEQPSLSPEQGS